MKKLFVILSVAAALGARAQWTLDFDEDFARASAVSDTYFTIRFLTGTFPTNLVLGASYDGPAIYTNAFYDSGDGVWHAYTSKNIPVVGSYVKFKGDWRTSAGAYYAIFSGTLQSAAYTCQTEGTFEYAANGAANAYREAFYNATALRSVLTNPFQRMTGAPAAAMCNATFRGCSWITSLPAGTLDTSGLTGSPAWGMCYATFYGCSGLTSVPAGTLDMSGLTGAPIAFMCYATFYGCSGLTSVPSGTLDMSGLTGVPAASMCYAMFSGCSGLTNATITVGSGITLTSSNLVSSVCFNSMFSGCRSWPGSLYWGTNLVYDAIPVPDGDINTFSGCTNMTNYGAINANWK